MPLPNFLIIGTAKAGTTSLYSYLQRHPQVYVSPIKETNFFAFEGTSVNFQGPGDAERINRTSITDLVTYRKEFDAAEGALAIGEVSPLYLYLASAPERIHCYLPDVKLVAILRNPVDRAYSSFLHLRRDQREPIADFAQALKQEKDRIRANWAPLWHYRSLGFYSVQLERYYRHFDRKQIQIYRYEDLVQKSTWLLSDLFTFLGVDPSFQPEQQVRRNVSGIPRSRWLHDLSKKEHPVRRTVKSWLPSDLQRQVSTLLARIRNRNLVKPVLAEKLRLELLDAYREDILRTQDLIEQDLSQWLDA